MNKTLKKRKNNLWLIILLMGIILAIGQEKISLFEFSEKLLVFSGNLITGAAIGITQTASSTSCGYVNSDLNLSSNISVNGTCFIINASHLVLDGKGYTILGNHSGFGVNLTDFNNITIKNINLINFSNGIYVRNSVNNTLSDSSITTETNDGYGIVLTNTSNTKLLRNNISTQGSSYSRSYGIYLRSESDSNNLSDNNIKTYNNYYCHGIFLENGSSDNTVFNNSLTLNGGNDCSGVYLKDSSSSNNIIEKNWINLSRDGAVQSYGLYLDKTLQNNLIDNLIISLGRTTSYGIYLLSASQANLSGNSLNTSFSIGLAVKGTLSSHFNHTVSSTNLAEGKPINYSYNQNNLVLDGINFTQYGQTIFAWGNNITIRNSNFSDDGLSLFNTSGSLIENNRMESTKGWGLYLLDSPNNTIKNNSFNTNVKYGKTLYFFDSDNLQIINNWINVSDYDNDGIYLYSSLDPVVFNNTILAYGGNAGGVHLYYGGTANISENNISLYGSYSYGIFPSGGSPKIISNKISIYAQGVIGIWHYASSGGIIKGNLITANTSENYGIRLYGANNNNITDNNLSLMGRGGYDYPLWLDGSDSNLIENNLIEVINKTNNVFEAICVGKDFGGVNNTFINNLLKGESETDQLNLSFTYAGRLCLRNIFGSQRPADPASYKSIGKYLEIKNYSSTWVYLNLSYYQGNLNDTSEANLQFWRYTDSWNQNGITDQIVNTNTKIISANLSQFSIFSVLGDYDPCGVINGDKSLEANKLVYHNGTCFVINASHIVLDGKGSTIIGNGTGYGINLTNFNNVTIRNISLRNFSGGIFLENSNNSNLILINSYNNSNDGIYLRDSNNNTLTSINSYNNSHGILLESNSNNNKLNSINSSNNQYNGIYLSSSYNNTLTLINSSNNQNNGIFLYSSSNNNLTSINSYNNSNHGIYFYEANNTQILNSNISNNKNKDFYLYGLEGYRNYVINTTFNKSSIGFVVGTSDRIYIQWYLDLTVKNPSDNPINNANTSIYEYNNELVYNGLTNSSGQIARQILTEFFQNSSGVYYQTPHNISALRKTESPYYHENSTTLNLTETNSTSKTLTLAVNNKPSLTTPVFSPSTIYTDTEYLNASTTVTDSDSDLTNITAKWFVNNINIKNETKNDVPANSQIIFNFSLNDYDYNKSDIIKINLTAFDGYENSTEVSNSITVSNKPPEVSTPSFNQSNYKTNEDIKVNTTYTDADLDQGTIYLKWFINNAQHGADTVWSDTANGTTRETTLSNTNFKKNDKINVSVKGNDGTSDSEKKWSTTLTINNTLPTITTDLTTVTINTSSTWLYDYNASDPDVDENIDSLTWSDNTTLFNINPSTGLITFTPTENQSGTYSINVSVTDENDIDDNIFILIINDTLVPRVNLTSPAAGTYPADTISLDLNYTVDESNLDKCWYSLNNNLYNLTNCQNTTFSVSSGDYTLTLYVNDTFGNLNQTMVSFSVESITEAPSGGGGITIEPVKENITECTADKCEGTLYYRCIDGKYQIEGLPEGYLCQNMSLIKIEKPKKEEPAEPGEEIPLKEEKPIEKIPSEEIKIEEKYPTFIRKKSIEREGIISPSFQIVKEIPSHLAKEIEEGMKDLEKSKKPKIKSFLEQKDDSFIIYSLILPWEDEETNLEISVNQPADPIYQPSLEWWRINALFESVIKGPKTLWFDFFNLKKAKEGKTNRLTGFSIKEKEEKTLGKTFLVAQEFVYQKNLLCGNLSLITTLSSEKEALSKEELKWVIKC